MTTAEQIAMEEYPDDAFRKADRATEDFPAGPYAGHETQLSRAAFVKGYTRGQQDAHPKEVAPTVDQVAELIHAWSKDHYGRGVSAKKYHDLRARLKTLFP